MRDLEGFILVGGASTRMGEQKSLMRLSGLTFVDRIRTALLSVTSRTTLVGTAENCAAWSPMPAIRDVHVKWGALGGLHAALKACSASWAAVVACDLPFVTGPLFERLASMRENFDAVVPTQPDGRRQALCSLLRASACIGPVEELIATGEHRPRALIEKVRARIVPFEELSDLDGAEHFFMNVNTREDYAAACELSQLEHESKEDKTRKLQ